MGWNWILFSRGEQGRKRYASGRVPVEPSEAGVSPAPSKMAGREDEARGILDDPSILKRDRPPGKNRPESALICNLGGPLNVPGDSLGQSRFLASHPSLDYAL